jgi:hypothetical protein
MDQAPLSIDAPTESEARQKLDDRAREAAGRYLLEHMRGVPPLRLDDAVGLTIAGMTDWWIGIHQRSCRLDEGTLDLCSELAVRYSLGADIGFAIAGGVLPRVKCESELIRAHFERWFCAWAIGQERILASGLDDDISQDPRERLLRRFARRAQAIAAPRGQLITRMRKGVRRWNIEWGQRPSPGDEDPETLAANLILAADKRGGILPLLRVGPSGAITIGDLAARDGLGPRGREKPRSFTREDDIEFSAEDSDPAQLAMEAEQARRARSAIQAVKTASRARAQRRKNGSAGHLVLRNAADLLSGQITLTQLAQNSGLAVSTLSEAWKREKAALLKEDSVRRAVGGF